jgi:hypothetical protein
MPGNCGMRAYAYRLGDRLHHHHLGGLLETVDERVDSVTVVPGIRVGDAQSARSIVNLYWRRSPMVTDWMIAPSVRVILTHRVVELLAHTLSAPGSILSMSL